jgi:hypothetical protein
VIPASLRRSFRLICFYKNCSPLLGRAGGWWCVYGYLEGVSDRFFTDQYSDPYPDLTRPARLVKKQKCIINHITD